MPAYRIFRFGGDGRILAAEVLDAETDDEAIAAARARVGKSEVWHASRLVARVEGKNGKDAI